MLIFLLIVSYVSILTWISSICYCLFTIFYIKRSSTSFLSLHEAYLIPFPSNFKWYFPFCGSFLGLLQITTNLVALNSGNLSSHNSGDQNSKITMLARLAPSGGSGRASVCSMPLLASVAASSPWHSLACSYITPISVTQSCPHMSVSSHGLLLSYKDISHIGWRAHPTPVWSQLVIPIKTLFQNKSHYKVLGARSSNISFGGMQSNL